MLEDCTESCVPCGLHQPVRNNYFDGKFLLSRDFIAEQDYGRGHRQMHNAYLHGTGTVCGLRLIEHPSEQCRREFVVCEPGLALDCCGQEIVVPERTLVRVREAIEADPDLQALLDGTNHLLISIARCDSGAEPVPLMLPTCDGPEGTEFGRIAEGHRFMLSARAPDDLAEIPMPAEAAFDWVHSFSYDAGRPTALHVNNGEDLVQIAVDDPTGSNTYCYDMETHELPAVLGVPGTASDTGSSREARWVFVAGGGYESPDGEVGDLTGVGVWRADALTGPAATAPAGIVRTRGRRPRIAVSPTSGTLYVLDLESGAAVLRTYSQDDLVAWLEDDPTAQPDVAAELTFDHGFGGPDDAAGRGASMLEFTRDGRFLVVASPVGRADERLYVIETTALGGGLTATDARPDGFSRGAQERVEAVCWSYDDAYLYVLTREPAAGGTLRLLRYAMVDGGARLEPAGSGVLLEGQGLDLAVAPTDLRAYLLMADPDGFTRFVSVDLDPVKTVSADGQPTAYPLPADTIRFDGPGRSLTLNAHGSRVYVAIDPEPDPVPHPPEGEEPDLGRGLVAVIDLRESDCTSRFATVLAGCTDCGEDHEGVVLGHLAGYVYDEGDGPRLRDADADAAEGADLAIDNLTYRAIVPSAATLKEVVECIVAQGVAEGPPGPRGDAGLDGTDGTDGTDGADGLNGTHGENGTDGLSIDEVTLEYADITEPEAEIEEPASPGDDRILRLRLPEPEAGGTEPVTGIPIIAASWVHGERYPDIAGGSIPIHDVLARFGIAIAFGEPVTSESITSATLGKSSALAELDVLDARRQQWLTLALTATPIRATSISGTLLEEWETTDSELVDGVVFTADLPDSAQETLAVFRLVLYADFVTDRSSLAVDGTNLAGRLPTGASAPGGTFRSWFTSEN